MARTPLSGLLRRPSSGEQEQRTGIRQFFSEVVSELKKVTWPTRAETMRLTLLVIAISAAIGLALGFIDAGFTRLFDQLIGRR